MSINLLSKHRKELMTIAMFWIAMYHSYFPINSKLVSFTLSRCGYGGVDLFLFLSSFGLYYAYKNYNGYGSFIKRRLLRILPYSIPFFIILFVFNKISFASLLEFAFGVSVLFRTDKMFWFVSFILLLYIFTPFYLKAFNKKPLLITTLVPALVFIACLLINNHTFTYIFFRISIYSLGFYFGYLNDNKKNIKLLNILLIVFMIIGWILMYYMYHHFGNDIEHVYPLFLIVPGTLMLLAYLVEKISFFNKLFCYLSEFTFVFYLFHGEILNFLYSKYELLYIQGINFDVLINVFGIVLAFIISVLYKKVIDKMMNAIIK